MKSRMRPLALVGIAGALAAASGHAQNTPAPAQVTQAITVVAQREPVVTVLAPRETPNSAPARPAQPPPGIGKALDADGDGIADAPVDAAGAGKSGRPSGKRSVPVAATAQECADKDRAAPASVCAKSNPLYTDKAMQGHNPVHQR